MFLLTLFLMAEEAESSWCPRPFDYILLGGGMYLLFMCFGKKKPSRGDLSPIVDGSDDVACGYGTFEASRATTFEDKETQTDTCSIATMWQTVAVGDHTDDKTHRSELLLDFSTGDVKRSESVQRKSVAQRMITVDGDN